MLTLSGPAFYGAWAGGGRGGAESARGPEL